MNQSRRIPIPSRVFARRIARIAFGIVLLTGWPALVVASRARGYPHAGQPPLDLRYVIGGTWLAAAVAGAVAYALAAGLRLSLRRRALFHTSLVLPVAAIALMLPITLHGLVALGIGVRVRDFNEWVAGSAVFAGIAHLVFAALSMVRVYRLADGRRAMGPGRIFWITVVVSGVPFALIYLIPPALVALTGVPILPLLHGMQALVDRERREIGELPEPLPRAAIVRRS